MKHLMVLKTVAYGTPTDTDDVSKLLDGQAAMFNSRGNTVTVADSTMDYRDQTMYLMSGNAAGDPVKGLILNPFDFSYVCTDYSPYVGQITTIVLNSPTTAEYDAAEASCCNKYKNKSGSISIWKTVDDKVLTGGTLPIVVDVQIPYDYDQEKYTDAFVKELTIKLKAWNIKVEKVDSVTIKFTGQTGFYFNVTADYILEDSVIKTPTSTFFGIGLGSDWAKLEKEFAIRDGYDPAFAERGSDNSYTEPWKVDPNGQYRCLIIESKTDAQYELLTNDNKGLLVRQYVIEPMSGTQIASIIEILDSVKANNRMYPGALV